MTPFIVFGIKRTTRNSLTLFAITNIFTALLKPIYINFSGESDEEINWCVVSKKFTLDDFDFKGINTVYLRLDLKSGSKLKYTQPGTMRIF